MASPVVSGLAGTRRPAKAGSWYTADPEELSDQLDQWLSDVPETINGSSLPIPGARVIIAPHAGYSYSGPCAAWAYKAWDIRNAKRIFILGPSHTYGFVGCDLSTFARWATPLGELVVDADTMAELRATGRFGDVPPYYDTAEHSLEMHAPYVYKRIEETFGDDDDDDDEKNDDDDDSSDGAARSWPTIVPLTVGDGSPAQEKRLGRLLAPYLRDPENAFVVSSDFCHWGDDQFGYTVYSSDPDLAELEKLSKNGPAPEGVPIHESIRYLDEASMASIETGIYDEFRANIKHTGNTVCGRHPIGVMMAALEVLAEEEGGGGGKKDEKKKTKEEEASSAVNESHDVKPLDAKGKGKFTFVQYHRSNMVTKTKDFSVSYASAYAVV